MARIAGIDLPRDQTSGLTHALRVLKHVDGVKTMALNNKDVVRNEIVQNIVRAYEAAEKREQRKKEGKKV